MTEATTVNNHEAAATKLLGFMLIAQSELLQTMTISSPTGMTAGVTQELAHHMRGLGQYLAAGKATAMIHDRQAALGCTFGMVSAAGLALELLNVRINELMGPESGDKPVAYDQLLLLLEQLQAGAFNPSTPVGDLLSTGLESYVGEPPIAPQ